MNNTGPAKLFLPLPSGTPDNVLQAAREILAATGPIADRYGLDANDLQMVLSGMVAVGNVYPADGDEAIAMARANTTLHLIASMTKALMDYLGNTASEAAPEPRDEPEIAALKAARGPSTAIH